MADDKWGSFMQGLAGRLTPAKENNDAQWLFRTMAQNKMAEAREKVAREHADKQQQEYMGKQLAMLDAQFMSDNGYAQLMIDMNNTKDKLKQKTAIEKYNALEKIRPRNVFAKGLPSFTAPIIPDIKPQPKTLKEATADFIKGGAKVAGDVVGGLVTGAGDVASGMWQGASDVAGVPSNPFDTNIVQQYFDKEIKKRIDRQAAIDAKYSSKVKKKNEE